MRLLLDSHVALWWLGAHPKLGTQCAARIRSTPEVYFSAVTPWELGVERAVGQVNYPDGLVDELKTAGFEELPISAVHAEVSLKLPNILQDPFGRLLIAQAQTEMLTFVTSNESFAEYGVDTLDATR